MVEAIAKALARTFENRTIRNLIFQKSRFQIPTVISSTAKDKRLVCYSDIVT